MRSAAQASDPTQQRRAENKRDAAVDSTLQCLDQAARGQHVAWSLSNALESVGRHFRDTRAGPISKAQCDELLATVVRAQLGAIVHLPESYPREQIDAGMQALAGQVMLWAEKPEISARRPRHALADLNAYARMLRNDMHNVSLREEIDRRAWERREQHIESLRNIG